MATYHSPYHDDMLERQIEQARLQRTGFYRRLADAGRRGGYGLADTPSVTASDISSTTIGGVTRRAELSSGLGRRKLRHSEESSGLEPTDRLSASVDNIRGHYDPLVFTDNTNAEAPKPQTSWRYYTSYDKDSGEWRRNAVPVFKTEDSDNASSSNVRTETVCDSKVSSSFDRHSRARGTAGLLQSTVAPRPSAGDDMRRARSEDTTTSLHYTTNGIYDEFGVDRHDIGGGVGPYGEYSSVRPYVDDVMRRILGDSWRRPSETSSTEEKVIYANTSRTSILDDGRAAAAATAATSTAEPASAPKIEIPEGDDESKFVEKTLAPSGRPWVSVPSLSERILMMSIVAEGDEVEADDGNDGRVDKLSDMRRAAVMDWLKSSADGSGGTASSTSSVRLAPVRSETTVREETRTTVEKIGGDRSTVSVRQDTGNGNADDNDWRQTTNLVDKVGLMRRPEGTSPFGGAEWIRSDRSANMDTRCEDDVIWMPVIHVADPAESVRDDDWGTVNGRESSTKQRVLSATTWSKQLPPAANTSTRTVVDTKETTKTRMSNSSSPVIIRPTAVMASSGSSCGSSRQSEVSPTPAVVGKESGSYSSSILLHTADRPTAGRLSATLTHGATDVDERSGGAIGTTSAAQIVSGGFRTVAVSGNGAWRSNSTAAVGDRQGAVNVGNGGVYRSETCFSVDAVEAADTDRRRDKAVSAVSASNDTGSRTWRPSVTTTMGSEVQQVPVNASSETSTVWNSNRSSSFQSTNGGSGLTSSGQLAASSTDADDGDWVIEKAI